MILMTMFQMSNTLLVPEFSDISNTFEVEIKRNSLGLGFSISGGPDAPSPWTNLIRVKKIFPLQPAWETGKLKVLILNSLLYYLSSNPRLETSFSEYPVSPCQPSTCAKLLIFCEPLPLSQHCRCAGFLTAVATHGVLSQHQRLKNIFFFFIT